MYLETAWIPCPQLSLLNDNTAISSILAWKKVIFSHHLTIVRFKLFQPICTSTRRMWDFPTFYIFTKLATVRLTKFCHLIGDGIIYYASWWLDLEAFSRFQFIYLVKNTSYMVAHTSYSITSRGAWMFSSQSMGSNVVDLIYRRTNKVSHKKPKRNKKHLAYGIIYSFYKTKGFICVSICL